MNSSAARTGALLVRRDFLLAAALLAIVLVALFRASFHPTQTLFSNDGPLGALMAFDNASGTLFTGRWDYLNWLGGRQLSSPPDLTHALYWLLGAVTLSKFLVPISLFVLGISAWLCLRELGLGTLAGLLGAVAAMLNSDPFSYSCWGLPTLALSMAWTFFALAALARWSGAKAWIRAALAGAALGMAIMEGFDNGAIFSLYVGAFVLFQGWINESVPRDKITKGAGRLILVAVCAAVMAAHTLSSLVSTQIQGVVGMEQDAESKQQRWDQATMWSLPKIETLRVVVPGLFGYRMDTPEGGIYWGAVGQRPGVPQSRHSGAGVYAGVLVILLAGFGVAQAARGQGSPFSDRQRKIIWFWTAAALISLLMAYGRHAPFYQLFYTLPYMSTIRNPIKFMHPFTVAIVILFAYGVEALWREHLSRTIAKASGIGVQLRQWWKAAPSFERRWTTACLAALGLAGVSCLIYLSSRRELEAHLQSIASPQLLPAELAPEIARFSITEAGWAVLFLALSIGVVTLILAGVLSGSKAKWAGVVLGAVLLVDLFRANAPWIIYYDYVERYATNPVLDLLREKPEQSRVAARLTPMTGRYLVTPEAQDLFGGVIDQEWLQHHYQFYRIQSLDIVQMPRMPEIDATYMTEIFTPVFSIDDFRQLDSLVAKLTNRTDAVSRWLWESFTPATRALLERPAGPGEVTSALRPELNRLIRTNSIYDPVRFAGVKLSQETRSLLGQNMSERDGVRVNRLLLEDAYPSELARRSQMVSFSRLWQLTNTRLILGMTGFLPALNQQMDPIRQSFRVHSAFDFAPKATAAVNPGGTRLQDITAVTRPEGQFAVFEFGAALPRAKLFSQWQVITNDTSLLEQLADPAFDPHAAVLLSAPLPAAPSHTATQSTDVVTITRYEPKRVVLKAEAASPAVLLLNDKFEPNWKAYVNGKAEPLLRCNYIMRGVFLPAGAHEVEFRFDPPHATLYVSLAAIAGALALCGLLAAGSRSTQPTATVSAEPTPAAENRKTKR